MLQFLKVFGRGVLVTILLPVILLVWVLYGVYCIGVFIVMFFKGVVDYFKGKTFNADLPEDIEARRMLLEREKQNEQAKDALSMMYQNAMAQQMSSTEENYDNPYEENPEPFASNEYSSDAYEPDDLDQEPEQSDDNYGDYDDDLRSN